MKVFIRESREEKEIYIYGISGDEATVEFFDRYFIGEPTVGIYETTEEEREIYHISSRITFITVRDFNCFVRVINVIQDGIDAVAEAVRTIGSDVIEEYRIDGELYVV